MRRPWLSAVAVVVVALVAAEAFVRWIDPQLPVVRAGDAAEMILKARRIDEISKHSRKIDLVFFGTSMMDSAVAPQTFLDASTRFDTVYNAGVVGAPTATQVRWAKEIVLNRLDPGVIVLGIHPIDLLLTDVLNLNIQPAQADVIFARVLRETRPGMAGEVERALNENFELVRQRGNLRRPYVVADATWNRLRGNKPKGFIPLRDESFWADHLTPMGESSLFHGEDGQFRITAVQDQLRANLRSDAFAVADVHRLIKAAQSEKGAQVVIVIPPVPLDAWREVAIDLGALRAGEELIKGIASQYRIPVIDFTDVGYENELFADLVHMNDQGAQRFSRDLSLALNGR
ncbi:MAG: SGNH/GDSL hydrolase family protein [Acidimicrobiales bacterium]|nr:SGNH/GDSL hydrolase family protein [Acidimicrobiales bacterium]